MLSIKYQRDSAWLICDSVTICWAVVSSSTDWSSTDSLRMLSSSNLDMFTSSSPCLLSLLVFVFAPDALASALLLLPLLAFPDSLESMLLMLFVTGLT
jgi:hypothetical protein